MLVASLKLKGGDAWSDSSSRKPKSSRVILMFELLKDMFCLMLASDDNIKVCINPIISESFFLT